MKKIALLALGLSTVLATQAMAIDLGIAAGTGSTSSTSLASSASQGSSGSLLAGATFQQSSGGAASGGEATSIMSGNDQFSSSVHQSETIQQGSSVSFGLAGSQNSNLTGALGGSAASNNLTGVWLFIQP